jgi:hypothetical protein
VAIATYTNTIVRNIINSLADPDPVLYDPWIQDPDPDWKKSGSVIRDEHPASQIIPSRA